MTNEWSGQAETLGDVLKEWRTSNGITLYSIAKFENTRIENIQKVEKGLASMASLCRYLEYIRCKDDVFFRSVLTRWNKALGFEL